MEAKRTSRHCVPRCLGPGVRPSGRRARKGGFSLAELLISIGILSIGMSMSAMLFPAAMKENERSLSNVLGTLICDNALSLGKVVLSADNPDKNDPSEVQSTALEVRTDRLGDGRNYPYGPTAGKLGCVLLARKVEKGGYQLVAVAYRKAGTGTVSAQPVTATISGDKITGGGAGKLRVGSPLIVAATGDFARIIATDGNTGTLEHDLPGGQQACFVIQESGQNEASPAMWTLVTKTGLRMRE